MRVKANSFYIYHPNLLDACDPRTGLQSGDTVRVVNLPGCPKANTMGHAHVEFIGKAGDKNLPCAGRFAGLVHTNSLHTKAEYIEYLRSKIAEHEAQTA